MSTVAKASITLTSVSDAYSVSLAPSVCVIHADFDGSNPVLTNAYTVVSVYCGEAKVPFTILGATSSAQGVQFSSSKVDDYTYRISIDELASDILEGSIEFGVLAGNDVNLPGKFQFTVERESTMLDWIQAWENNKTTIGATSIITPKLFVGKKITGSYDSLAEVPGLTGVYIGPSENDSCGLYGYKDSIEIFHLDETGGKIGGWDLSQDGLYSSNGKLRILSDGSIRAVNDEFDTIWEVCADGSASFALGNVKFYANGDAEFKGKITSSEGNIAGWTITDSQLHCVPIALSATGKYIALANIDSYPLLEDGSWDEDHFNWVQRFGGVAMFHNSSTNFGLLVYKKSVTPVFKAGSTNFIAGWNFDENALWIGTKNNNSSQYTVGTGSLTIGTEGLRGHTWYINANGTASFVKGLVTFGETYGNIAGWVVNSSRLANDNVALISAAGTSGLYLTDSTDGKFIERSPEAMENFIDDYGGIYLKVKDGSTDLAAYNNNGYRLFKIKSGGTCYIAGWCFNNTTLYTGTQVTSGFTATGHITLGPTGLRGYKWRFENDGSGALAGGQILWNVDGSGSIGGGNVSWDKDGNITFSANVSLNWTNGIDEAKQAADDAQTAADKAQKDADKAVQTLTNIASDSVITVQEKATLKRIWENVVATYTQLVGEALKYSVDSLAYNAAYNNIKNLVEPILSAATDSTIDSTYTENWQAYYTAETKLYSAIVSATKALADNAQQSANNADAKAVAAAAAAAKAQTAADGANTKYTNMLGTYLTHIGSDGIYTGQLVADQIVSGTISTADIKSTNDVWHLYNDGSGALANGNISWDKSGNVTFGASVTLNWSTGINNAIDIANGAQESADDAWNEATNAQQQASASSVKASVAQMIAFGQMLYRDPEFTKDKKNETAIYAYNSFDYCKFSASQLAIAIRDYGFLLRGNACVTRVDILKSDGTTNTVFTGARTMDPETTTNLRGPITTVTESDTIRISYTGEDAWLMAEALDDDSNHVAWLYLCGNYSIIGTQYINTSRKLIEDTTAPNSTQQVVQFTNTRWITNSDFRLGGFLFANKSRANGKFVVKIVAKIPVGWKIENYHNAYGDGGKTEWITSQSGTDAYTEYICVVTCGATGTFSTINHFALKCDDGFTGVAGTDEFDIGIRREKNLAGYYVASVVWYVAYATVFDATSSDKVTTTIDAHGIYTGTLRADQIIAGTIDATKISADVILSNGDAWALNKDGSGYLANGNISWDASGNTSFNGEIVATSGKIGGLDISSHSIGLDSYDNSSNSNNGVYLSSEMICFNQKNRQAILGCWSNFGLPVTCRIRDSQDDVLAHIGLAVSVTGSMDVNTAIEMGGGWLSGLNYKVEMIGYNYITASKANETQPTEYNVSLDRSIVCVYASTQFYWRTYANRNDSSKFETKTRTVNITLPDMKHYDNGHVLMIKRGPNNSSDVYLKPGASYKKKLNSDGYTYYEESGQTCILVDNSTYVTDKLIVDSEGDAMQLVYFRDLSVTINSVQYKGVWVQFKNPRTW